MSCPMTKWSRESTALATVLALAGPFVAPTAVQAQNHPYASNGAYENVNDVDVSAGSVPSNNDADRQYDDVAQKDVTQTGISPDNLRPAQAPLDTSTQEAAQDATTRQRQSDMTRSKIGRQTDRIYQDYQSGGRVNSIVPYLEASQLVDAQISPKGEAFTYSVLAAGVDAVTAGPNHQGSLSFRYERRFGWGKASSFDNVSGVGHGMVAIVPDVLHFEVAGYANRTHIEGSGATTTGVFANDALAQVYSVMAGPSLATEAGDLEIKGHYRIGYSHVGTPGNVVVAPGQTVADIFDHSTVQDSQLRVGTRPGDDLPVGLAVEGGHYIEKISNLDQVARDSHIRGEVTVPFAEHAALVGGIGYEWTQVSSHDAVRDAAGNPVISSTGRVVTDHAGPRHIAFDTRGLIWDAGVIWRPSPRTNLEAHVGRRYGEFGGYGTFTYKPTHRSSFNVLVYDNMAGFGGMMTNSLANLPTQFSAIHDSLTGNVGTCVNSGGSGNCLTGALATVRSTVFRGRGVSATYNWEWSRFQAGFGGGYDRRRYIAAPGTVLAPLDGKVEEYTWVAGYLNTALDEHSSVTTTLDAYWFHTGVANNEDFQAVQATAIYQHQFTRHLSGTAAVGVDGINRQALEDVWSASGQVGVRYSF